MKIFQLKSMSNAIKCIDQRFAFKNSGFSCLALICSQNIWFSPEKALENSWFCSQNLWLSPGIALEWLMVCSPGQGLELARRLELCSLTALTNVLWSFYLLTNPSITVWSFELFIGQLKLLKLRLTISMLKLHLGPLQVMFWIHDISKLPCKKWNK